MKKINKLILVICFLFSISSCSDITEINESPNNAEEVSSDFILTYVLTETSKAYYTLGKEGGNISGAMQYTQRGTENQSLRVNSYDWQPESWSKYYDILRNNEIIYNNAIRDDHKFFQAVSLVMKSFIFGTITDLYGDCPYSESLNADEAIYFPKYDEQKYIYKGILEDLKKASDMLASVNVSSTPISGSADVIYNGDPLRWRKFSNSLRLRYCMRLDNKRSEMEAIGINLNSEFSDASSVLFESNNDSAIMEFLGIVNYDSAPGGPLNTANPGFEFKPCNTLVDKLSSTSDPRLDRWMLPVIRKWDVDVIEETDNTVTNIYGESQLVTFIPANGSSDDTSLYVGLPPGLSGNIIIDYNKGDDINVYDPERSPYISFLHDRYREDANEYVNVKLMTLSEVEFILAEAALTGSFNVNGSAEEHYREGIKASWDYFGVDNATTGNDFEVYYSNPEVNLNTAPDKLERIIGQKWISGWMGIQSWFDWRRTGFPDLQTGPVAIHGDKLPLRFFYPTPNLDPSYLENYNTAVERLEATPYVSTGQSADHSYSRMWLIQSTNKPW